MTDNTTDPIERARDIITNWRQNFVLPGAPTGDLINGFEALDTEYTAVLAAVEALEKECFSLAANQCHDGYAGEHGHHCCHEVDKMRNERDAALAVVEAARVFHKDVGECSLDCEVDYRNGFDLLFERLIAYDELKTKGSSNE